MQSDTFKAALLGLATGDALGVPVEFMSRETLRKNPVTGMRAFGTHQVPAGTFSDDASLSFCLAEALCHDIRLLAIAENFVKWYYQNYWTARGQVFDIGISTREAIQRLAQGHNPLSAGNTGENANGNGSLMRILPLLFALQQKTEAERFGLCRSVSAITHGHIRSVIACHYYLEFARELCIHGDKYRAYQQLQQTIPQFLAEQDINPAETALFSRLLQGNIYELPEEAIQSSGYVLHTLEASVWCLLCSNTYSDAVLKAVNLGSDSDTTAAVTGGIAGILYGSQAIPEEWLTQLARRNDIEKLAARLAGKYENSRNSQ